MTISRLRPTAGRPLPDTSAEAGASQPRTRFRSLLAQALGCIADPAGGSSRSSTGQVSQAGSAPVASASARVSGASSALPQTDQSADTAGSAHAQATPNIAPLGTPNELVRPGQLVELGGGVYFNTVDGTYQDLAGTVVGTNRHAVQQYTDPAAYMLSGAAFAASDAHLRATVPNLDELVPPWQGSPTAILNQRWAFTAMFGQAYDAMGRPAHPPQNEPVRLLAYPGVLRAPGPPPLEGTVPPPYDQALDWPART